MNISTNLQHIVSVYDTDFDSFYMRLDMVKLIGYF